MSNDEMVITPGLNVSVIWSNRLLDPFVDHYGFPSHPETDKVTAEQAAKAWDELQGMEKAAQSLIHAYHERTGSLPAVGDELSI